MPDYAVLGTLKRVIADLPWPHDFFSIDDLPSFLDKIFILEYSLTNTDGGYEGFFWLAFEKKLEFKIPGLDGVSVVAGQTQGDLTFLKVYAEIGDTNTIRLVNSELSLRYEGSLLTPVPTDDNPNPEFVSLTLKGTIALDDSFDVTFEDFDSVDLSPAIIGKTGIIISANGVSLDVSRTKTSPEILAAGFDDSFLGVFIGTATIQFPEGFPTFAPEHLVLENCAIGSGGVSGRLEATYDPPPVFDTVNNVFTGRGAGELFGVPFGISRAVIDFKRGTLQESSIKGRMQLPFFEELVDVELGLRLDGSFGVSLTSVDAQGLLTLTKSGLLSLELDSLAFTVDGGTLTTIVSGTITPLVGDLSWPSFRVNELAIDSQGNVRLEGGWLDLPDQYSLDFYGFQLEITKLGFGKTEDGKGKWLGFSGGIKFVDGIKAGASVDGLRITWYETGTPTITFDGVGVEFEIPDTLRFKGFVGYKQLPDESNRFDGSLTLSLLALDMEIDGKLIFGTFPGQPAKKYGALYLATDLPAGIPLLSTGVALYGMAGLVAMQMEPDKLPTEDWYRMGGSNSWYHRGTPGVETLDKWDPMSGSFGLGAGVTLGTAADNGYTFAGKFLFVIVLPGPILLLQGAANLLKDRAKLSDEPQFRALAVLDGRAGTFLIGLDAQYKYKSDTGSLIDIRGSAEAFFSFHDPTLWHLYLGQRTPQELRIRASLAKNLFQANAYFMLDGRQLAMGAWIGFNQGWQFPPLSLSLEAWIEGNALVSWRPTHLFGELCMHGSMKLKVFKFSVGLTIDACISADVREPFHLLGTLSVGIDLPKPLKDITVDVSLEWGPEQVSLPNYPQPEAPVPAVPLPTPLKEIAIEHFKVTTSWPPALSADPVTALPVVPLDCRPHLTFARPTHDVAQVGMNGQAVVPDFELIGDPTRSASPIAVRYALEEITLSKRAGTHWILVARKGTTANPNGEPLLFGSWAPVPSLPDGDGGHVGQTKLWLWSKTPYDYTRHTGGAWDDGFGNRYTDYPHCESAPDHVLCCTFEDVLPEYLLTPPLPRFAVPGLEIGWQVPPVRKTVPAVLGFTSALCFPAKVLDPLGGATPNQVTVELPPGTSRVTLLIGDEPETCVDFTGRPINGSLPNPYLESGASFRSYKGGNPAPNNAIVLATTTTGLISGLECRSRLEITLPYSSSFVDMAITCATPPATVDALGPTGALVARITVQAAKHQTTVRFTHGPIKSVVITSPSVSGTTVHHVCFDGTTISQAQATVHGVQVDVYPPISVQNHVLDTGPVNDELLSLVLTAPTPTCLLQVCVTVPTPEQRATQHLVDERARWTQTAPILDPHTVYQLVIHTRRHSKGQNSQLATGEDSRPFTDYAYFKTDGPPALANLTIPADTPNVEEVVKRNANGIPIDGILDSALDTLAPYVAQTIPATVPAPGEKPPLPRPVYRAYDVGVQFDEDYVDLMYRLEGRDLGLYLYDRNNRPVRDAEGRLLVLTNRWGRGETPVLDRGEGRWINAVNNSDCLPGIDTSLIPKDVNLTSAAPGLVLDADTVYEARLVPLLLREDFTGPLVGASANDGEVPGWAVQDDAGPSVWEVDEDGVPPSPFVVQTSLAGAGSLAANDPVKPGTMLERVADPNRPPTDPSQPANWSDYRLTVTLRTGATGAIGVVFRMKEDQRYYRFSLDRSRRYRRLVRVGNLVTPGVHTILAEDDVTLDPGMDTVVTAEVVGPSLRVYQDGALVFDVVDDTFATGGIALYAWKSPAARFSEVRVDDFSPTSAIAYRFAFTTSEFASFVDHLHSFQDEVWRVPFIVDPGVTSAAADAQLLTAPVTDAETRTYEILAAAVLGTAARQDPPQVEVTRVEVGGELRALLVRGPEPIDWTRSALTVLRAGEATVSPARVPGALKLTGATFAELHPAEESVTLVTRTDMNPSGSRVEVLLPPGPLEEPAGTQFYLRDDFDGPDSGRLFQEGFGPNALDHYLIADIGTVSAPSAWSASSSEIVQAMNTGAAGESFAAPRTATWTDVRVTALVRSDGDSTFGVAVRYRDPNNHYACVLDTGAGLRTIRKVTGGVGTTLFQDAFPLATGRTYQLAIDASGDRLFFYLDEALVAVVQDAELASGRVALYSALATGAHFSELSVEALEAPSLLYQSAFEDSAEIEPVFGHVTTNEDFMWTLSGGLLTQTSPIADPTVPDRAATFAVLVSDVWTDADISVRLMSTAAGFLGVAFRWTDVDNAYRFSLDGSTGQAVLLKVVAGAITSLWNGPVTFALGQASEVTLRTEGPRLTGFLDGTQLFAVTDSAFASGQVALFCGGNPGASFSRVVVADRVRRVGGWTVADEGNQDGPSIWHLGKGLLRQRSAISGGADPVAPGTIAVSGDATWSDYRVTARMSTAEAQALGVVFRYRDRDNYYRLSVDPGADLRTLVKKTGGAYTTLWPIPTQPGSGPVGAPFTLTVDALGSRIVGYQDGVRLFDVTDTDHATGAVGVYCAGNPDATFESVDVRRPPQEAYALLRDRFPGDTAGWEFLSGGTQAVAGDPTWTDLVLLARVKLQAADAVGLIVRYADSANYYSFTVGTGPASRQLTKTQAGVTTVLWSDAVALVVGRAYELVVWTQGGTLRCFLDGVPVCVVEDASPVTAGKIGLSSATGQIPARFAGVTVYGADRGFSDWLLDEPLDEVTPGRWTIEDAGDTDGPSVWNITGGAYVQSSGITGGTPGEAARPGTFALTGDPSWSDYRLSVRLASSAPGDIGVLVRYIDPDNYYLLSLSLDANLVDGRRRLIAVTAGTPTVLAEDQVAFELGNEALVTVDCIGTTLRAFVDGKQVFAATHPTLPFGRVGLYTSANPGGMFAEARVASYDWLSYYEFAGEDRIPAGTPIQLVAGNAATAPPAAPGVISRALAFDGERGRVRFPAEGVDLRVIALQNVAEHTRRILPPAAFAPADLRVLRSADGTGLALIAVAGAPVADGEHRFQLTYRRDNRSVAPDSLVFTQDGDATEESATLDVPLPPN